jgi:hypothetical protein
LNFIFLEFAAKVKKMLLRAVPAKYNKLLQQEEVASGFACQIQQIITAGRGCFGLCPRNDNGLFCETGQGA